MMGEAYSTLNLTTSNNNTKEEVNEQNEDFKATLKSDNTDVVTQDTPLLGK